MQAFFGFQDGSGDWFVILDTDKCDGCGDCVLVCPATVWEVGEDEFDPMNDEPVARVRAEERKKLRYSCAPCQPGYGVEPAPCVAACAPGAISHSDGWRAQCGRR